MLMGRKTVKAIFFSFFLVLGSMIFLNFLSYVVLVVYSEYQKLMQKGKYLEFHQVALPNYSKNRSAAQIHFEEKAKKRSKYAASVGWIPYPLQGQSLNVNADGDRVHKIPDNILNEQAAYFFGGSTMFGFGAWDNETIPALFGSIANLPTYNMGQEGWISRQGLARFINLISKKKKIDLAIFYDGYNDVSIGCRAELKPQEHERTQTFLRKIARKHRISVWKFLEFLTLKETKRLAAAIRQKLLPSLISTMDKKNWDKWYICDDSKERARGIATALVTNWEIAHDIAAARNIQFYAVLHPTGFIGTPKLDHLQEYYSTPQMKEKAKQFRVVYPMIQELLRERKHEWIFDYTDAFSRNEYIYIGGVHTSPNGNQIIAERLYKDIFKNNSKHNLEEKN